MDKELLVFWKDLSNHYRNKYDSSEEKRRETSKLLIDLINEVGECGSDHLKERAIVYGNALWRIL